MSLADLDLARSLSILEVARSEDGPVERRALHEVAVGLKLSVVVGSDGLMRLLGLREILGGL